MEKGNGEKDGRVGEKGTKVRRDFVPFNNNSAYKPAHILVFMTPSSTKFADQGEYLIQENTKSIQMLRMIPKEFLNHT